MDALDRADQALARAQARGDDVVTPDSATSPMDQATTVRIPRSTIAAADQQDLDPDATLVIAPGPQGFTGDFGPYRRRR